MIDIPEIFKNRKPDREKLAACGFLQSQDGYTKDFPILKDQFIMTAVISTDGKADLRVYESESGEEYMPAHVYSSTGSFVGEIHKACESILKEIARECFFTEIFKWEQSKRILQLVKDSYAAEPEFLWSSLPECAALRIPGKKPWFAAIGRVPKGKIGLDESGTAELINLKDDPKKVKTYLEDRMAFPAYHMNKQHWYSILLDDRLEDDAIMNLIGTSFSMVNPG